MRINIFMVINQINKHKAKIYNQCTYTKIIIKKKFYSSDIKKNYVLVNIRMINLSLDELRLAQSRNIREYENKSKEDLTKALSESEPKPKPKTKPKQTLKPETKPKTKPKQTPKQTLKPETKLKPEPKIEMKVNRKKIKKLRKDFDELRLKFSNKDEIRDYRKAFYDAKKYKLSESKIEEVKKILINLKKVFKV